MAEDIIARALALQAKKAAIQGGLPPVTAADNGKVLGVTSGAWGTMSAPTELPTVTSSDNGKLLGVANGAWGTVSAPTELYYITITKSGSTYSADKTYAEITAAISSGKEPIVAFDSELYQCFGHAQGNPLQFVCIIGTTKRVVQISYANAVSYSFSSLGNYSKPVAGIPKTDLATAVQDALLPSVTSGDEGKAYSVSSGAAGWNSKAVPIPADVSATSTRTRNLVASPAGAVSWADVVKSYDATEILDNDGNYSLNDYTSLALQSFITSAAGNPGAFTAATQTMNCSTSATFAAFVADVKTTNIELVISIGGNTLAARVCSHVPTSGYEAIVGHVGGSLPVTGVGTFFVSFDCVISASAVNIIGFAMPNTMTQAPASAQGVSF